MWSMPTVEVGDRVLFYDNPFSLGSEGQFGFVSARPGNQTIQILVFTQSSGFVEKLSVRHIDDPFWSESELAQQWSQWGCWKLHPETQLIKDVKSILEKKTKKEPVAA